MFLAPVAVDSEGALLFDTRGASLSPSGRQLDLETQWRMSLNAVTQIETTAALVSQAGHSVASDIAGVFWFRLKTAW